MKNFMCLICSFVFDEEEGDVESGVEAGTRWGEVPREWRCPECGGVVSFYKYTCAKCGYKQLFE